ncbi:MAG TPA: hydroxyacid dehydrogenase [Rheinheimera sp.]|uniref:2-hydroxyacid dehydrogenase n=1 Tax=Rheinheimera sp. TaxID=1869214 RepID=UPI000EC83C1E|nr:2-hydroxyacid dehydrogenase [Rheinheimera sp.]HCU65989.1 hydroxyacid dehydrogenase [Rheinheimera sp.]
MNVTVFSSQPYDERALRQYSPDNINWQFLPQKLDLLSVAAAAGSDAVCVFVNDDLSATVLQKLSELGIFAVALRCAGFNNVDLTVAKKLGVKVMRVPAYSPQAVAEHTVGMMLCLSRKFHKAYNRTRDNNFDLNGLLGFNLYQKTVGLIGTGRIGIATARILQGFGCELLCVDPIENPELQQLGARYVGLSELYQQSDIISLHCPLTPQSQHLINEEALAQMKNGVMLINTSRGALINTKAVIQALKSGKIGYLGLDVYEQEADLFFKDLSDQVISDEVFQRLLTFPNVLITGHQAFFTKEAMAQISQTTIHNLLSFSRQQNSGNEL